MRQVVCPMMPALIALLAIPALTACDEDASQQGPNLTLVSRSTTPACCPVDDGQEDDASAADPTLATDPMGNPLPALSPHATQMPQHGSTRPVTGTGTNTQSLLGSGPALATSASPATSSIERPDLKATAWLDEAKRPSPFKLDTFKVTDQQGNTRKLSQYLGKPILFTSIYTRCPIPGQCPLAASRFAELEHAVHEAGLTGQVQLLLMTFDPDHDTPEVLNDFGSKFGMTFHNITLLQPQRDQLPGINRELELNLQVLPNGTLGHRQVDVFLIDAQGRWIRSYRWQTWDTTLLLNDLRRVATETRQARAADRFELSRQGNGQ